MATAESITINCRACEHSQEMPASYSGRTVRCAKCGERQRAPVSESDKRRSAEKREQLANATVSTASQILRIFVNLIAVLSVLAALLAGGWMDLAATMIFWAVTFSGWEIVNRLDTIADILRRRDNP